MSQFERVTQLEGQGKLKEAARVLEDMARDYPDVRTYSALGICLAKDQQFGRAGEVLRAALRLEPDHVQAHYFLGLCLFFEGEKRLGEGNRAQAAAKFREAAEHAAAAIKQKPDHAMANLFLGRARRRLGQRDEGLASMRQAVVLSPHTSDVHLHLGEALAEDGRTEEALVELREAVRLAPPGDPRPRQALERVRASNEK